MPVWKRLPMLVLDRGLEASGQIAPIVDGGVPHNLFRSRGGERHQVITSTISCGAGACEPRRINPRLYLKSIHKNFPVQLVQTCRTQSGDASFTIRREGGFELLPRKNSERFILKKRRISNLCLTPWGCFSNLNSTPSEPA